MIQPLFHGPSSARDRTGISRYGRPAKTPMSKSTESSPGMGCPRQTKPSMRKFRSGRASSSPGYSSGNLQIPGLHKTSTMKEATPRRMARTRVGHGLLAVSTVLRAQLRNPGLEKEPEDTASASATESLARQQREASTSIAFSSSCIVFPESDNGELAVVSSGRITNTEVPYLILQPVHQPLALGIPPQARNSVLGIGAGVGALPAWLWHPACPGHRVVANLPNQYPVMRRHGD